MATICRMMLPRRGALARLETSLPDTVTWEDTQNPWFWLQFMPEHTDGARAAWFIENYCTHTDGELLGEPFILEPWQIWMLSLVFEIDPATGLRRWREIAIVIPRGNGKSAIVSALGFYFLVFDNEGAPEVYSSAWGEDQAGAVFEPAKLMWDASPKLQKVCDKFAKAIVSTTKKRGTWKVVSKIATTKQGKKPHALLNDELHVHPRGDLRDTFIKGMHKRRNPIALDVTTEGIERQGPLENLQLGFMAAADQGRGSIERIHEFLQVFRTGRKLMIRWGVPRERQEPVSERDVRAVRLCNPLSVINVEQLIEDEAPPAPEKKLAEFLCYYMNHAVDDAAGDGVPHDAWDACAEEGLEPIPDGEHVALFVDAGYRRDCSAVVVGWKRPADGRVQLDHKIWAPARDKGMDVDLDEVKEYVDAMCERYHVDRLIFDPMMLPKEGQQWTKRMGARRVREYRFQWGDIGPDSVTFLGAVQKARVVHSGDREYRRHVLNMRTRYGPNAAWRYDDHPLKKEHPEMYPNDAGIASTVVVGELLGGEEQTHYAKRGLLIVPPAG